MGAGGYVLTNEIQVWSGGENIAVNGTGTTPSPIYRGKATNVNSAVTPLTSPHFTERSVVAGVKNGENVGIYVELTLAQNYNVYDIQSIVHYSYIASDTRNVGNRIELLDENNVLLYYSPVITEYLEIKYYRFDGPSSIPSHLFTTNSTGSISQIMNEAGTGVTWEILDYANEPEP